jgi:hypothetical protein
MKILNASPEFGKQLNEGETREFLTKSKLNVHIGTIDSKGDSNIHPTWYYYDTESDKFYIETSKNSKKIENMEGKGLVYFCVDEPKFPYKGVRGKGKVKIHENIEHNIPIAEKIMIKYLGSLAHPMASTLMSNVRSGSSVILEVVPSYYSTWNYATQNQS